MRAPVFSLPPCTAHSLFSQKREWANHGIALAGKATIERNGGKLQDFSPEKHGMTQPTRKNQDTWKSPVLSSVQPGKDAWNVGAGSGYSRDRQASWDAREMRTATTKVRREVYEVFQALCKEQGETPYSVLRDFLLSFVDYYGGGGGEEAPEEPEEQEPEAWTGWHSSD